MAKKKSGAKVGWIPVFGQFDVGKQITFHGHWVFTTPPSKTGPADPSLTEKKEQASLGLLLSSHMIGDGLVSAEIEFQEPVTEETFCELAVSYDANQSQMVTAGLGGAHQAMYSIREYGGPRTGANSWWHYRAVGDRVNLEADRPYRVQAAFRGAITTLSVDSVEVGTAEVLSPVGRGRQVGILCKAPAKISIRNFSVESSKPKAFVVMQFGTAHEDVYHDVIREVMKDYEAIVLRADEISGPGLIISDIIREISTSQLIVADITPAEDGMGGNQNVYFEVGYALALQKATILLAKKNTRLPFDISGFRVLFYEDTIGGKNRLDAGLRRHLDAILGQ